MNKSSISFSLFALIVIILFACNHTPAKEETTIGKQLVGEWNNISLKINIQSINGSNSNDVFEAKRGEWERVLKIKPIRTFFNADGTWHSDYYTLSDSLFRNSSGKWWVKGDSLVMQQKRPSSETSAYHVTLKGDTVSFSGMLDWDRDGDKDDLYHGEQIRK